MAFQPWQPGFDAICLKNDTKRGNSVQQTRAIHGAERLRNNALICFPNWECSRGKA
ncbi:hypothetical protein SPHINGOAX6_70645 [Sphingomonas sp. AX6]|nr:hypothetical protein SPHINGOAX6_70645 [Sphingomonas sp. AX6]